MDSGVSLVRGAARLLARILGMEGSKVPALPVADLICSGKATYCGVKLNCIGVRCGLFHHSVSAGIALLARLPSTNPIQMPPPVFSLPKISLMPSFGHPMGFYGDRNCCMIFALFKSPRCSPNILCAQPSFLVEFH